MPALCPIICYVIAARLEWLLFSVFDVDDLTALVHSGLGVDTVRLLSLAGIFVKVELRDRECIMGAPLPCA
jgi:hypothetical protein